MKKLVLQVLADVYPGGGPNHLLSLLKNMNKEKFDFYIVCSGNGPLFVKEVNKLGFPVEIVEMMNTRFNVRAIFSLAKIIKKVNPDLIHLHGTRSAFLGVLAAKLTKIKKVIYTLHVFSAHENFPKYKQILFKEIEKFIGNNVSYVITLTDICKNKIVEKRIFPENKLTTIHNGIDINRFKDEFDVKEKRKKFNIKEEVPIIGMVGRLTKVKGPEYFLRAAAEVRKEFPQAIFLVVGEGELKETLEKLSQDLQLNKNIIFTGYIEDVLGILSIMDIFISSSIHEGLSIAMIEAMAMGLPIVATDVDGSRETINKNTGIMVPIKDVSALAEAISSLLRDKEKAKKFGEEAKKLVQEKFNLETMIRETEELYEKVLD